MLKDILMVLPSFMFRALWNVERCYVTTKIYVHSVGSYSIKKWVDLVDVAFLPFLDLCLH
jgi:hypothetical protein